MEERTALEVENNLHPRGLLWWRAGFSRGCSFLEEESSQGIQALFGFVTEPSEHDGFQQPPEPARFGAEVEFVA